LTEDLAVRLDLPADQLQVSFNPKDERVLNLSEPQFRFNLEPARVRNLGEVEWNVLVVHDTATQKVPVAATARAWQNQVLVARPLSARQVIRPEDVAERRTLVDRVSDEPLLTLNQAVGQQASRDLRPGTVMTSRTVEAVPLVKPGQYVTITVYQGSIRVKAVGKAMEGGSYGQSIRVKNEATNDIYEVILTGPQEGTIGAAPANAPVGQPVAAAR
jgi:flagella basal body P-ring formation protein FlgA